MSFTWDVYTSMYTLGLVLVVGFVSLYFLAKSYK